MPTPRIFISSTCYDLKYIRENLKFFIRNFGYEPILSEEGAVFYDPALHVQDACLAEVPSCQIFVLIIGGRHGGTYMDTDKSITNVEYREAVKSKVPIFALVEQGVYDDFRVYMSNIGNPNIDESQISYPSVDSHRIFKFIQEIQSQVVNNALVPFIDFESIQSYLKQQWAGMFYQFLTLENESSRVTDILSEISRANERIEFLTRQVVGSVSDPLTLLRVELYDSLLPSRVIQDLVSWKIGVTPNLILASETLDDYCDNQLIEDEYDEESSYSLTFGGPPYRACEARINNDRKDYLELRFNLIQKIHDKGFAVEDLLINEDEPKNKI